jgi:hypothetical protein
VQQQTRVHEAFVGVQEQEKGANDMGNHEQKSVNIYVFIFTIIDFVVIS